MRVYAGNKHTVSSFLRRKMKRSDLEILDKPLEKSYKVFCFSDISRNGFFEEIFREDCTTTQPNRTTVEDGVLCELGLLMKASSSAAASCSPSTSLAYSSCSFDASVFLILELRSVSPARE
jgi:hypothetical protein